MKSHRRSFNIYFVLVCLVAAAGGCSLLAPKKQMATLRLYMEGGRAHGASTGTVFVTRAKVPYNVEGEPFLTEGDLTKAALVDDPNTPGSYALDLTFNDHGTLLLEMYSADNLGKHIIVFSQFPKLGEKHPGTSKKPAKGEDEDLPPAAEQTATTSTNKTKTRDSAWLAAVLVRERISSGTFRFTPDASRSEGMRIVRGLQNVIAEVKKRND